MSIARQALLGFLLVACGVGAAARGEDDILLADFEGTDYGQWTTTGTAFGSGPVHGGLPGQMKVSGFFGKGLVNSFHGGDKSVGTLTSPRFTVTRRYISFLIGGGGWEGKTCMNLLVGEKIVRTATGPNIRPGGSEELAPASWDVSDLLGHSARIQIVDQATGGWGHVNVDQIVLTDQKPHGLLKDQSREILLNLHYLNFPVKTGAPKRRVSVVVDGQIQREFDIELADADPQFWVALDVSHWQGKTATLHVDRLPEHSTGLQTIESSDSLKGAGDLYSEKLRPQFHFSSARVWNNDPNGLVFYEGEYHLFYQYNPYGWTWGNMHWGHAISPDLVHWTELPIAIYPHQYGDWAFSGSAVVDAQNTSGFKSGSDAPLVAAYTSTGRGECIAYSNDRGRTWAEFAGNPVVKHHGRDPRLLWFEPGKCWVMAVYDEFEKTRNIAFYTSRDLKEWTFQSRIEGFYECPDMFELPVDGKPDSSKWVLTAASSEYMIGSFDGKEFKPESAKLPGQRGNGMYAAQTYSNIPASDGRRIQIGWGRCPTPGMPFNQMMTFPCELSLHSTPDGVRMFWNPVREIESLRKQKREWNAQPLKPRENPLASMSFGEFALLAEFDPRQATEVGFRLKGLDIRYSVKEQKLTAGDKTAPLPPVDGHVRLHILVDRSSVEIFANDGAVYMPMAHLAEPGAACELASDGDAMLNSMVVYELESAWPSR